MNRPQRSVLTRTLSLVLAAGLAFALVATAASADHHQKGPDGGGMGMSPDRQQMHQKMMEEMKAHDDKIEALATQMNQATGQAKVDAMAALLNEMVAQRRTMRAHMEQRQSMRGSKGGKMGGGPPKPPEMN